MVGTVEVLPDAEFEQEILRRSIWMKDIPDEDLWWKAGPRLYKRCAACHSVDGSPGTGPTWKGLWPKLEAGQEQFADGTTLKDLMARNVYTSPEDYVQQSIWFPNQHIVHGFSGAMPTFKGQLDDRAVKAITDFIKHLSMEPDNFNKDGSLKTTPAPATPAPGPQAAAR
jgi:cytochrome c oxidase subunit 2